jgi:hypothetical protein
MSTRCLISAKIRGLVYTIYCYDGYPEHIIPLLRDHYNTRDKIGTLLLLGNTSAIYETIEDCSPYCDGTENSEDYENSAPSVFKKFEPHTNFRYEYYWDGDIWLWRDGDKALKPISEFKEIES